MCRLLMSINPEHVDNILSGTKKFEFRKTKCKKKIDGILIYSTAPVMRIVGEAEVTGIIEGTPQSVWDDTAHAAGIDKKFFDKYYGDRESAIAYVLGHITRYQEPLKLEDFGIKKAPQSYVYIKN